MFLRRKPHCPELCRKQIGSVFSTYTPKYCYYLFFFILLALAQKGVFLLSLMATFPALMLLQSICYFVHAFVNMSEKLLESSSSISVAPLLFLSVLLCFWLILFTSRFCIVGPTGYLFCFPFLLTTTCDYLCRWWIEQKILGFSKALLKFHQFPSLLILFVASEMAANFMCVCSHQRKSHKITAWIDLVIYILHAVFSVQKLLFHWTQLHFTAIQICFGDFFFPPCLVSFLLCTGSVLRSQKHTQKR